MIPFLLCILILFCLACDAIYRLLLSLCLLFYILCTILCTILRAAHGLLRDHVRRHLLSAGHCLLLLLLLLPLVNDLLYILLPHQTCRHANMSTQQYIVFSSSLRRRSVWSVLSPVFEAADIILEGLLPAIPMTLAYFLQRVLGRHERP
jgi:hypothetical protein